MKQRRVSTKVVVLVGLVVSAVLAFGISGFASSRPDGLEKVAADHAIDTGARASATADSPLADYSVRGVEHSRLSTGLAGVIGVAMTLLVMLAVVALIRRRRPAPSS